MKQLLLRICSVPRHLRSILKYRGKYFSTMRTIRDLDRIQAKISFNSRRHRVLRACRKLGLTPREMIEVLRTLPADKAGDSFDNMLEDLGAAIR